MRLPDHLEFVVDDDGLIIHGMGPHTLYIRNKITNQVHQVILTLPAVPLEDTKVEEFQREFERAFDETIKKELKEQLNEDFEH